MWEHDHRERKNIQVSEESKLDHYPATNEIAKDLQALRDRLAGGLTAAEADAVVADLDPIVARLTALGEDPADPVPTV